MIAPVKSSRDWFNRNEGLRLTNSLLGVNGYYDELDLIAFPNHKDLMYDARLRDLARWVNRPAWITRDESSLLQMGCARVLLGGGFVELFPGKAVEGGTH